MTRALILVTALVLDRILGEPRRAHPLVAFGALAHQVERRLNRSSVPRRVAGVVALALVVGPVVSLSWLAEDLTPYSGVFIRGGRSLSEHAHHVLAALRSNNLSESRRRVGHIVSRDTSSMQKVDVVRATIESILENGSDAIFTALFYYLLAGVPGVVAYRLVNTLDAMWGYKTERFSEFGWATARLDDVMNYIPARFAAFSYALFGNFRQALRCWKHQGKQWESPNAGPVMAAGAGSLCVRLGGAASYHGQVHSRPELGCGAQPDVEDIPRALAIVNRSILLWCIAVLIGGQLLA